MVDEAALETETPTDPDPLFPVATKKVVLHNHPDLDAYVEFALARDFPAFFPRIEEIKEKDLLLWPQGPPEDGRTWQEHWAEGTVGFDTTQGPCDHHPHSAKDKGKCGTDKVADIVGIDTDPLLGKIYGPLLNYVRMHDLEGPTALSRAMRQEGIDERLVRKAVLLETFSLYSLLAPIRKVRKNDKSLAFWLEKVIGEIVDYNRYFLTVVGPEFLSKSTISKVITNDGRILNIASIESEIHQVGSYSRTEDGGYCHLCLHRNPESGQNFITGSCRHDDYLDIGRALRYFEMKERGITEPYRLDDLDESEFKPCDVWYFPRNDQLQVWAILNGGQKATAADPSSMSLELITKVVTFALSAILHPDCPRTSCLYDQCGFYPMNLNRCQRIRK